MMRRMMGDKMLWIIFWVDFTPCVNDTRLEEHRQRSNTLTYRALTTLRSSNRSLIRFWTHTSQSSGAIEYVDSNA